jgi:hypothetical protein
MGKSNQGGKVFRDIYVMNVGEGLTSEVGHQSPDSERQ